ncbi:cobalamin synthase [Babesia caballi]|uniref:Cobalamin synthase n=1 Tax=Babesia caballi TaxID=5871 RepID=A0AAV4LLM0_BABCB|nr:cobalamin synthase [Babesia caballi]
MFGGGLVSGVLDGGGRFPNRPPVGIGVRSAFDTTFSSALPVVAGNLVGFESVIDGVGRSNLKSGFSVVLSPAAWGTPNEKSGGLSASLGAPNKKPPVDGLPEASFVGADEADWASFPVVLAFKDANGSETSGVLATGSPFSFSAVSFPPESVVNPNWIGFESFVGGAPKRNGFASL